MTKKLKLLALISRRKKCAHTFKLEDLKLTSHDQFTKRVEWPCSKCAKLFHAHCGLDILKNGTIVTESDV